MKLLATPPAISKSRFQAVSLLLLLLLVSLSPSCVAKRLVVLAGPHYAAQSSAEEFFYHYAAKHKKRQKETFGLRKWRWPHFNGTLLRDSEHPQHVMSNLVDKFKNEDLQQELMEGIQETWDDAHDGMIIGTAEFDRATEGGLAGFKAVERVVKQLDLKPENVTIVLNYRTPRFDQWISRWWDKKKHNDQSYSEYMCDAEKFQAMEWSMSTSMNPMAVAKTYYDGGYIVELMDLAGIEKAGRDVATVIACDVVGAVCDDGVLRNHEDHPYHENEALQVEEALPDPADVEQAEELLRGHDCYYEQFLRDKIHINHNVTVWSTCSSEKSKIYELLKDPAILFRALLSQVKCNKKLHKDMVVTMDQALNGKVKGGKGKEATNRGGSNVGSETETTTASAAKGGGGSTRSGIGFEIFMFPLILLSAFGAQVYRMHESLKDQGDAVVVRETEMSELTNGRAAFHDEANDDAGSNKAQVVFT